MLDIQIKAGVEGSVLYLWDVYILKAWRSSFEKQMNKEKNH